MKNLKDKFLDLKENIKNSLTIKEKEKEIKSLNDKKRAANLLYLYEELINSFNQKKYLYENFLTLNSYVVNNHLGYIEPKFTFTQIDTNLKVEVDILVNLNFNDILVFIEDIPRNNNVFYFIDDNNQYKYAKVRYDDTRMNFSGQLGWGQNYSSSQPIAFNKIKSDKITWINSTDELTDELLDEILNKIKKDAKLI